MTEPTTAEIVHAIKYTITQQSPRTIAVRIADLEGKLKAAEKESKQDAEVILRIGNQLEAAELLITTLYDSGCLDIEREELVRKHIYGASHE